MMDVMPCGHAAALASEEFDVSVYEIAGRKRDRHIVDARHAAIYIARTVHGKSYPTIGRQFGLDHTTCMHAVDRVERRIVTNPVFADRIRAMVAKASAFRTQQETKRRERMITNAKALPVFISTSCVCDLAGYGPATLMRRIQEGGMPQPSHRGKESMFERDRVLRALGLLAAEEQTAGASW